MSWKSYRVLFVGDQPSSKNVHPKVPFVGTSSYKRLLRWIGELDLDIHRVSIVNSRDDVYGDWVPDLIIFLGKEAEKKFKGETKRFLVASDGGYFELGKHQWSYDKVRKTTIDHPSPRNRKLNSRYYETVMLENLKKWIYEG
jgi:uracil-DNA glycosylase